MTKPQWKTWGQEALEPGPLCPEDEQLRLWVERTGSASAVASEDVEDHVRQCPRCSLEAEEMRTFFAKPEAHDQVAAQSIERSLRETLSSITGAGAEQHQSASDFRPRPRRRGWSMAWGLAAATLFITMLVAYQMNRRPSIPSLDEGAGALRGEARPVLVHPAGEQETIPRRMSWAPGPTSGPWEVRLEQVDGSLLWSTTTSVTELELPESVVASLRAGSRYWWHVQAVGGGSARATVSFRVVAEIEGIIKEDD